MSKDGEFKKKSSHSHNDKSNSRSINDKVVSKAKGKNELIGEKNTDVWCGTRRIPPAPPTKGLDGDDDFVDPSRINSTGNGFRRDNGGSGLKK